MASVGSGVLHVGRRVQDAILQGAHEGLSDVGSCQLVIATADWNDHQSGLLCMHDIK
jgi:hypothetical protein